jgi:hypothetical protein
MATFTKVRDTVDDLISIYRYMDPKLKEQARRVPGYGGVKLKTHPVVYLHGRPTIRLVLLHILLASF